MKVKDFVSGGILLGMVSIMGLSSCLKSDDNDQLERFEKDQLAIDEYIAAHGYINVQTDTSGYELRYLMVTEGTGDSPEFQDWMYLDYEGHLLNDTIFDQNDSVYLRLQNDPYASDALISGWLILMPYLKEGGEMLTFIPSYYGYGRSSSATIPANSPLVFRVKLHKVLDQLEYEQVKITDYLEEEGIVAETDTVAGLRYIITEEKAGDFVQADDKVNVDYDVKYLMDTTKTVRLSGNDVTINLASYLPGWKILLPYTTVGSEIVMYLPSKYVYGSSGSASLQGDQPLIYTVKVNSIVE